MSEIVLCPTFPRIEEYLGCWCMEPRAMAALWDLVARADLPRHMESVRDADAQPAPKSLVEKVPAQNGQSVAVIPVLGTMMKQRSSMGGTSTIQLRRDVRQAAADPDVSSILLAVESPGGSSAGTEELANEVKAARRKKPVWAHIDDLGASAAYWVASQAGQVFANNASALVGSIGTRIAMYDLSESFAKDGVKAFAFATGPLKAAGMPGLPITEEQQRYFQSIVDATQSAFDAAVRSGRGLSAKELADVRTGAVFSAAEAQSRKLIDGVRPIEKTIEALADAAGQRAKSSRAALVAGGYEGA